MLVRLLLPLLALVVLAAACGGSGQDGTASPEQVSASPGPAARELLYISDSAEIIVIDATVRSILRTIPAGYTPDIAVSPDERFLFIASFSPNPNDNSERLSVYDTSSWEVATKEIDTTGKFYHIDYPGPLDWTTLSADGRLLWFAGYGEMRGGCGDCDSYMIAIDLSTGERVKRVHLPSCAASDINLDPEKPLLYTLCLKGGTAVVDLETGESTSLPVYGEAWDSVVDRQAGRWYILTRDLEIFPINLSADLKQYPSAPEYQLADPRGTPGAIYENPLPRAGIALSPDGSRLYVGVATSLELSYQGLADEIWAYGTDTWQPVARLKPGIPASHFALSRDGRTLYAVNAKERTLAFIDIETGREEVLHDVGHTPAKIVVSP